MWHGGVGTGIDNRGVALFNDQMHGSEAGADVFGIQGDDAERVVMRCCWDHGGHFWAAIEDSRTLQVKSARVNGRFQAEKTALAVLM
jgi:hypothetical protein